MDMEEVVHYDDEDELFGMEISCMYTEYFSHENISDSPFEIGEIVQIKKSGITAEITGIRKQEEGIFEYILAEQPFLFYDIDLEKL